MKIVAISDTHNLHEYVKDMPQADVLIHTGDSTMGGSIQELERYILWLGKTPYKRKVVIAGNHDFGFNNGNREAVERMLQIAGVDYLRDSAVEIDGVKFWGAPWTPWFHDWAFNLARGEEIMRKWELIPEDTNVLLTHGPPFGILDYAKRGLNVGCEMLLERTMKLKQLKYHVFGHIHEAYGMVEKNGTTFVNACTCTARYAPTNKPFVIEL